MIRIVVNIYLPLQLCSPYETKALARLTTLQALFHIASEARKPPHPQDNPSTKGQFKWKKWRCDYQIIDKWFGKFRFQAQQPRLDLITQQVVETWEFRKHILKPRRIFNTVWIRSRKGLLHGWLSSSSDWLLGRKFPENSVPLSSVWWR